MLNFQNIEKYNFVQSMLAFGLAFVNGNTTGSLPCGSLPFDKVKLGFLREFLENFHFIGWVMCCLDVLAIFMVCIGDIVSS